MSKNTKNLYHKYEQVPIGKNNFGYNCLKFPKELDDNDLPNISIVTITNRLDFFKSGSLSIIWKAYRLANLAISPSLAISAIFSFIYPCCLVPKKSPGPLNFKSSSAIKKPSDVDSIIFNLSFIKLINAYICELCICSELGFHII